MKHAKSLSRRSLAVVFALSLSCSLALANKPDGDNRGKSKKPGHSQVVREPVPIGAYFVPGQRTQAIHFYGEQRKAGRCPPGLAKKNNGCMPPGQAKKWRLGQSLPGSVVLYPVPQAVIIKIGPPPAGYRYVRVANDLLLIAIGTRLVVDAIEDLMDL